MSFTKAFFPRKLITSSNNETAIVLPLTPKKIRLNLFSRILARRIIDMTTKSFSRLKSGQFVVYLTCTLTLVERKVKKDLSGLHA